MSVSASSVAPMRPTVAQSRKAIYAATIGNVMEWYDFGVFGFLAGSLALNFFPKDDPRTSLLNTFLIFGVGPDFPSARRHRHRPPGRPARPQARLDPHDPADGGRHGDHRAAADLCVDRRDGAGAAAGCPPAARVFHRRRMGRRHRLHGRVVESKEAAASTPASSRCRSPAAACSGWVSPHC